MIHPMAQFLWLQCQLFITQSSLLLAGNIGFILILAEYSSAIPQQQRWGLRPVANCEGGQAFR